MSNEVNALSDILQGASIKRENKISIKGQGLKLDSAEDAVELIKRIKDFKDLESLELTGNTIGVDAAKAIAESISSRSELKRCLWADIFTGRLRSEIPHSLISLGKSLISAQCNITEFDLSDNAFGPDGVKACVEFLKSKAAFSLQVLKFNNNGLGGGGVILADALIECHNKSKKAGRPLQLKTFIAGRNRLENPGATALSKAFKQIGTLEEIQIPQNGIQHQGIAMMADCVRHSPHLRHINLNDNTFTNKGAIAMAEAIKHIDSLEIINFGDCLVRTEGARKIAASLQTSNPNLKELNLSFGEIRLPGGLKVCECMQSKENLKLLDLNGNQFGEDGCDDIQKLAENLKHGLDVLVELEDDEGDSDDEDDSEEEDVESDNDEFEDKLTADNIFDEINQSIISQLTEDRLTTLMTAYVEKGGKIERCITMFMKLTGLIPSEALVSVDGSLEGNSVVQKIFACYDVLLRDAFEKYPNTPMMVINPLFVAMALIKNEEKKQLHSDCDVRKSVIAIKHICCQKYLRQFEHVRDVIKSLVGNNNNVVWSKYSNFRNNLMLVLEGL